MRSGSHVTLIARTTSALETARQELARLRSGNTQKITAIPADVSDHDACAAAVRQAAEVAGAPDVLITSAGMCRPGYFRDVPMNVFEETMRANYFGTLYAVRAALPFMDTQGRGKIVMISSGAGLTGLFGYTPYSPTKFALRGLAEALRCELRPAGIGVSIVYPPDTDTPQLHAENKTKPPETRQMTESAGCWTADDVAAVIIRGMAKNRFAITPGWEMTLLNRFSSVIAPILGWYFDRIVKKHKRQTG